METFALVFARFHTTPDVVVVDEGPELRELFSAGLERYRTQIISTSVKASFSNGRVERLHRVINETIRAKEATGEPVSNMVQFAAVVQRATQLHNTQLHTATGCTPHEMVFIFQHWINPDIQESRLQEKVDYDPINPTEEARLSSEGKKLPEEGETWLWKHPKVRKKDLPFTLCQIIKKLSTLTYRVKIRSGKTKHVHIRHLKKISPEAVENIPKE